MKSKEIKIIGALILIGFFAIFLVGINVKDNKINVAYVNWAEGIAMSNLAKVILEDNGYQVNLLNAGVAPIFASMPKGDIDLFMDTWLPITHKVYIDKYGDELEDLGNNYDDARLGLVVPDYVDINSIEELNDHADAFNHEIIGIDPGAGLMKATRKAIPAYDLDLELKSSSGAAMTATLKKAIDRKEWVVVTGWTPHWMFSRFDLKILKDPKGVFGNAEVIKTMARGGFTKDHPKLVEFFKNVHFNDEELSSLMEVMTEATNKQKAAKQWAKEHKALIESWLPEDFKAKAIPK